MATLGIVDFENQICCSDTWEVGVLTVSGEESRCFTHDYNSGADTWADFNLGSAFDELDVTFAIDEGADLQGDFSPSDSAIAVRLTSVSGTSETDLWGPSTVELGEPLRATSMDVNGVLRLRWHMSLVSGGRPFWVGVCDSEVR